MQAVQYSMQVFSTDGVCSCSLASHAIQQCHPGATKDGGAQYKDTNRLPEDCCVPSWDSYVLGGPFDSILQNTTSEEGSPRCWPAKRLFCIQSSCNAPGRTTRQ